MKELTIGRWEKGQTEIPLSAEIVVRMLFTETVLNRKPKVKDLLNLIADLEDEIDRHTLSLDKTKGQWTAVNGAERASVAKVSAAA